MKTSIFYTVTRDGKPVPLDGKKQIPDMRVACNHYFDEVNKGGRVALVRYKLKAETFMESGE